MQMPFYFEFILPQTHFADAVINSSAIFCASSTVQPTISAATLIEYPFFKAFILFHKPAFPITISEQMQKILQLIRNIASCTVSIQKYFVSLIAKCQFRLFPANIFKPINTSVISRKWIAHTYEYDKGFLKLFEIISSIDLIIA